jgi:hypothetical protein
LPPTVSKYNVEPMLRVLIGVLSGMPSGIVLAEVRRGWRVGSAASDVPPFAADLGRRAAATR